MTKTPPRDDADPKPATDPSTGPEKSFGNISDRHWSRARAGTNEEALDYYRQRSRAPGVAEGGASRNFYCMHCDGVIPYDESGELVLAACPHCGESITGASKRYFNWVEINDAPRGDARFVITVILGTLVAASAIGWIVWKLST